MKPTISKTAAMLAACAATSFAIGAASAQTYRNDHVPPSYQQGYDNRNYVQLGVVQSVETIRGTNQGNRVAGAILGGVLGGVLGHQIGSGRGNDVATVAGALGGAAVGHGIARDKGSQDAYRVTVRMDNGETRVVEHGSVGGLRTGDRVRVDGDMVTLYAGDGRNAYPSSYPSYQSAMPPPPDAYAPDAPLPPTYDDRSYGDDRGRSYGDDRGYRYDREGNRVGDAPGYRNDDNYDDVPSYRNNDGRPDPQYRY